MLSMLHTIDSNEDVFAGLLSETAPEVPVRHAVRPDLLADAMRVGADDPEVVGAVRAAVLAAADGAAVVLCTCSTIGGIAESVRAPGGVRVLRVDRAMARRAVEIGPRIVVTAALESTLAPTRALVEDEGRRQGRALDLAEVVIDGAWRRLQSDGQRAYHECIADRLREIATRRPDAIVLAQATMAGAADLCADLGVPVLASPRLGLGDAVDAWRART